MARKKGKKKRKRRYTKRRGSFKKRRTMGVMGKMGVFMAAVVPQLLVLTGVATDTFNRHKQKWSIPSMLHFALMEWVNGFSYGLFGATAFKTALASDSEGRTSMKSVGNANIPKGALWYPIGIGTIQVSVDRGLAWINGNRGVNIIGTKTRAIGNY